MRQPLLRRGPVLVLSLSAALLGGCFSTPKPPKFEVIDAGVTQRTESGTVVTFLLKGTNENADPLPLENVSYSLSLDGREVFSGVRLAECVLPAKGEHVLRLPVPVASDASGVTGGGAAAYRLGGSIVYKIPGSIAEIFFDSGLRRPTVGFGEGGTLEFARELPPAPALN